MKTRLKALWKELQPNWLWILTAFFTYLVVGLGVYWLISAVITIPPSSRTAGCEKSLQQHLAESVHGLNLNSKELLLAGCLLQSRLLLAQEPTTLQAQVAWSQEGEAWLRLMELATRFSFQESDYGPLRANILRWFPFLARTNTSLSGVDLNFAYGEDFLEYNISSGTVQFTALCDFTTNGPFATWTIETVARQCVILEIEDVATGQRWGLLGTQPLAP